MSEVARFLAAEYREPQVGIMVCGHGSRDDGAMAEFQLVAAGIAARLPDYPIETGYLEFARPIIREGLSALVARGVRHILAVPGMLFAATHVKNDLPWELNTFMAEHPEIDIRFGRELGIDPKLLEAARARIEEAEAKAPTKVPRAETLLVVVGRGTTDSDANSNIAKVARMLWEGMGFGWAETVFSGVAFPRVDDGLERATRLGFKRVIVFPYFLFTGILVNRIYDQTREIAARHPEIEFLEAPYLRDHPLVLDAFVERVREIEEGMPAMNCQLCKYRTQIIGFEEAVGAVQAGHHHHVVGANSGHDHHHDHAHGHTHARPFVARPDGVEEG
ncbi:MAG: sirohydrochlorin cobaltochelatase [Aliidongia sp.]|jgi:sirohydrochlorin cobaltochelatase|nr:sirohydrochlorin cobaltochelatase [Aliidongia sp.]